MSDVIVRYCAIQEHMNKLQDSHHAKQFCILNSVQWVTESHLRQCCPASCCQVKRAGSVGGDSGLKSSRRTKSFVDRYTSNTSEIKTTQSPAF